MRYEEHVDAIEREAAALVAALRAGPLDARVPTCPDWAMSDLALHIGQFLQYWLHVLCEGSGRAMPEVGGPPDAAGLADWVEAGLAHLVAEFRATPPGTELATWAGPQPATWAARRSAHELAIHRFDAQGAHGARSDVEATLAIDGIDEIFVMVEAWPVKQPGDGRSLHVHATDTEAEWLITMTPDGLDVRHEHAKGDLALRGAVSDLELVLYDRPPNGPVEHFGDDQVLDTWHRVFKFG